MPIQAAPAPLRAALYVDFDNVFSSLAAIDEWAAWSFATAPARWLAWLEAGAGAGARRLLVRRCYLNPAGWHEPEPGGSLAGWLQQPRIYYSRFRADFVRAGIQVVDCPRLARLKNGADMVMALDILDALAHPTRFDEFLILSGDSDFTPLLHRLRAHDRRSLVVTHPLSAQAFRAAADAVLGFEDFAEAALVEDAAPDTPPRPAAPAAPAGADATPDPGEPMAQRAAILALLRRLVAEAEAPLHLPGLGKRIHEQGGAWVRRSRFGGAGTLARLIEGAEGLALEAGPGGGWLYDPARHDRPSLQQPGLPEDPLGRLMAELRGALGPGLEVPRLGPEELDFALRRLAGMLPLPGPPAAEQRAALAAEASAAGFDLPARALDALVAWLHRARVDWRAAPEAETPARLGRALFAEITRQAAAAGTRLPPATLAALRDWIGLGSPRPAEAEAPTGVTGPPAQE
ncbi:NYN domain-containing protein [Paracraurococcus lichenis]|uniref:NYN domain-containing protein n=1 Tax=Paracraurococcus lichenis TaxID=3064888 RepID=A0ABT9DYX8_9PROT|nr:NYN domain-containing protein [Paracraurococcus sp. LOR1-02]MDO9709115.1 NYN domain-containing protein [Paracraurococcus sp. LOR1-02]